MLSVGGVIVYGIGRRIVCGIYYCILSRGLSYFYGVWLVACCRYVAEIRLLAEIRSLEEIRKAKHVEFVNTLLKYVHWQKSVKQNT